ncbi:endothelin-converting enzyme homolog [Cataglyphis hispanica]|uniref:endothelin-converting enzyme homolog n=1 Tax=Cataglyphis hispanica TaxID=1086592 RepID=UPI0021800348|nr:endothelin-converting enzyme homolog [Cataglyphis hispanica]XP_050462018.1 endothelin-converting enzyme homolog [Cataglyphis hispanica]
MVERHRLSFISRRRVMRRCYRGWTNRKIDVRVAVISVGSTKKYEHYWENVNVWTAAVVCTTRLGIQCRQFDPVSGPFSMNNERKDEGSVYSVGSQNHLVSIRSKQTYFKKRFQLSILLVIILCLLVFVLFITVLVLAILYAHSGMMKICDNEDCVRIAASLKESMDTSVDPCDDFYQYACGRWPQEHPIPDSSLTNSWFSERSDRMSRKIRDLLKVNMSTGEVPWAVMQAKTLFTSCMDVRTINELDLSPLFNLLKLLNLPLIPAAFTNETTNYVEQMARVKRILGLDIFFGLKIMSDPRNNSNNVIYFDTPDHTSPFPSDKELEKRLHIIRSRLRKLEDQDDEFIFTDNEDAELIYMSDVVKQVISNSTVNDCTSEDELKVSVEKLKEFIGTLYEISNSIYHMVHANINYTLSEEDLSDKDYMLVDDLQKLTDEYIMEINSSLTPQPIWRSFVESLFEGIVTLDLDNKDKVLVGNLDYLKDAALILAVFEEEALESYVWWTVVDTVVPHSSEKLRNIWTTYINKLMEVEIKESKSLHCASTVNKLMGMAVSWLFVDPTFHSNKGRKVMEMLEDIKEAFASLVVKMDWMDQSTKIATLEKNRKMRSGIGFPEWLFDEKQLDEYYEGIDLSKTKYLDNMIQIIRLQWNSTWASLRDYNLKNESYWATDPIDVNAFHTFQNNYITVPIGILQFPFYELGLEALNYGAIGSVLGHELTHGFDNSGRHYDSDGNFREWWTNKTISEYTKRTQCFINHYNTYYENEINAHIDGELTLDENIADNGGVREAFVAYGIWKARHGQEPLLPGFTQLTHEQLLFLAFAHVWCESYTATSLKWMLEDSHSPAHVRLQAVLKNSKEFSAAWKCPVGSNMNPSKKCHLW